MNQHGHMKPQPARVPGFIEAWSPTAFFTVAAIGWILVAVLVVYGRPAAWISVLVIVGAFTTIGLVDFRQTRQSIRRNFPVLGRFRYVLESLRPEIRQYFIESDQEETPFSREKRSIIYSRAKNELDTLPFGTVRDVYRVGYEWMNHSMTAVSAPSADDASNYRIHIGEGHCKQPYPASLLNISAMSYGSLSGAAIRALNLGAKKGNFYHNTGEGSISPYHRQGGDLVWQIGTGYFGCRTKSGQFDIDMFADKAQDPEVKMIELKLSQGAKPGHGGILPAAKVTREIADIRHVPLGQDVISPPAHNAFATPIEMMEFIAQLRERSGGKPIGIKLCLGSRRQFYAVCKAMLKTDIVPDFITVDGAEGGTGAAPLEFANSVGVPLNDGLHFIHNAMIGANIRGRTRLIAAGKLTTGFHMVTKMAMGADICNAARPMMFAVGCIQALKCNTNHCPVGVATQDPKLTRGLVVADKSERVYQFHRKTVQSVFELLGAAGIKKPENLRPYHIYRRVDTYDVRSYGDIYPSLEPGALLANAAPVRWQDLWTLAKAEKF